jgi:hypothetical protein
MGGLGQQRDVHLAQSDVSDRELAYGPQYDHGRGAASANLGSTRNSRSGLRQLNKAGPVSGALAGMQIMLKARLLGS